jgi:hypothetical protein
LNVASVAGAAETMLETRAKRMIPYDFMVEWSL